MSLYLGVDVGTQSVKTLCYDAESRKVIASATAPLELTSGADGSREQLARWWVEALHTCLADIDSAVKQRVAAIGVSGQQHGFVPLGADGSVLAPVKLWCDTATTVECDEITEAFGGSQRCIEELGNAILPGYTASKIRWLKNHRSDAYRQLHSILLPHDYLNFYLTGERSMEWGDASGTGLLDVRERGWHRGMLAALDSDRDLAECLPELLPPTAAAGQLRNDVAAELGLPAGTPVSTGGGDNMMAAIGTGNVLPGRLTVSLGTSGTLFAASDSPVVDTCGDLAAFCSSTGGWLPLLCTMNCTVATELTRNLLGADIQQMDDLVAGVEPGSGGVMTLPFFNGERTPNLPEARGCIMGLDAGNYSQGNLLRSAMESATYGLRAGLARFEALGCAIEEIRLTGGGAGSAVWRQMVADIFKLPVRVLKNDEGAALGAALQSRWMLDHASGGQSTIGEIVDAALELDEARSCEPQATAASIYEECYQHYLKHVDTVIPLYT